MYQRKSRRYGAAMVALSLCLRLGIFLGLDAKAAAMLSQAARQEEFAAWMLYLETGKRARTAEETQPVYVLEVTRAPEEAAEETPEEVPEEIPEEAPEEAAEEAPEEVPEEVPDLHASLPATLVGAEAIAVVGGCTYSYDKAALLSRPSTLDFSSDEPTILIVHTHASESYNPEAGEAYETAGAFRTLDTDYSVIQVGKALAETLRSYGLGVVHDATINDYPSYNDSYANSLSRIEAWKKQYPSLQMVIDLHRDAAEDEQGNAVALTAQVNGEDCAQLMLVVGTDQGGLYHPNWQENLANALKLQSVLEGMYPGLCRSLNLRTERFNQHETPGSILVEVGCTGNTLTQAKRSAVLLGEALASMIESITQGGGTLVTAP